MTSHTSSLCNPQPGESSTKQRIGFLDLPGEIRNMIYGYVADQTTLSSSVAVPLKTIWDVPDFLTYQAPPGAPFLRTCKQVSKEFRQPWLGGTWVIKIGPGNRDNDETVRLRQSLVSGANSVPDAQVLPVARSAQRLRTIETERVSIQRLELHLRLMRPEEVVRTGEGKACSKLFASLALHTLEYLHLIIDRETTENVLRLGQILVYIGHLPPDPERHLGPFNPSFFDLPLTKALCKVKAVSLEVTFTKETDYVAGRTLGVEIGRLETVITDGLKRRMLVREE